MQLNLQLVVQLLWEQLAATSSHRLQAEPSQRIFIHLDYILSEEAQEQVDDLQAEIEHLWSTPDSGVIQFKTWLAREERQVQVTVYPVCLHYARRVKYLSAYGIDPEGKLGWHNYRLDRITSKRLKVLAWGDSTIPKALKNLWYIGELPSPDDVKVALDAAWGFNFYLRVALSVKEGKIRAATILRKLGTNSSKNRLYQAFYELGCAVRSGFLLHYINDAELRATIQATTNKSEAFNGFAKWLSFGGNVFSTNNREEQRNLIRYNHLVANSLIFHNVFQLSQILEQLVQEGYTVEPEAVAALSPYWTHHVNRFGVYQLDLTRQPLPINYGATVVSANLLTLLGN